MVLLIIFTWPQEQSTDKIQYIYILIDWSSIKLFDTATKVVAQASNRIMVGLPLCELLTCFFFVVLIKSCLPVG